MPKRPRAWSSWNYVAAEDSTVSLIPRPPAATTTSPAETCLAILMISLAGEPERPAPVAADRGS